MSNVPIPSDIVPPHSGALKYSSSMAQSSVTTASASRYYEDANANHQHMPYLGGAHHNDVLNVDIERGVTARMLNQLAEENKSLRSELEGYIKKTFKLQQVQE